MRIVGTYSFNRGQEVMQSAYEQELQEVRDVVSLVDSSLYKTKQSKEKTMVGRMLYHPSSLNLAFKEQFGKRGWKNYKVKATYKTDYYIGEFAPTSTSKGAFRDMDFLKNKVGVEVQFGKYSFMVYNVCAKMTIFHKLGAIDVGVEIVAVKDFADEMSTGVSYFEQFVWDLEHRGPADIDIPVLILGIAA